MEGEDAASGQRPCGIRCKRMINNKVMLVTYPDSLGDNLKDLDGVLDKYYREEIGGIHILPFFPSSGDRGFAPITYDRVDPAFGDWDDIKRLSEKYYLMCDYMINHISARSEQYQDFLKNHEKSRYHDFFINWDRFWGGEPSEEEFNKLYLRKKTPYITAEFADGQTERLWSTFSEEQIDIDCLHSEEAKKYLTRQLRNLAARGISLIRTDAMAYAAKRKGENCFFVEPEMWTLVDQCREALAGTGVEILPEIHENYFYQKKLEEHGIFSYDFQLPFLILNAVWFGRSMYLKNWLKICPRKQFTTLDTHDGIGVVDARYLLPDEEILKTQELILEKNPIIDEIIRSFQARVNFSKFKLYQINCTYYDALGSEDNRYLLARAIQFFTPGIPQVYYVGLFAGRNDEEFFRRTLHGRDINRHYYSLKEIDQEMTRPVVLKMRELLHLRNTHEAFGGEFNLLASDAHSLNIRWENGISYAQLYVDFQDMTWRICYSKDGGEAFIDAL